MTADSNWEVPDHSIQISVDRGGTFSDVHASFPKRGGAEGDRGELVIKLLSVDKNNYEDAPTEGIRRVLEAVLKTEIPRGQKLETKKIDYIRLSTTVATNALLERKGARHAFVTTKGFKDLLRIGNQSRPSIFALEVRRPEPLYEAVVEVDERVTLEGYTSDPKFAENGVKFDEEGKVTSGHEGEIVRGVSGEAVRILKRPDLDKVRESLQAIYDQGIHCLAICLIHSFTFPDHEQAIAKVAKEIGFEHISISSSLSPQIKAVPRATSSTADAYLTPVLREYIQGFFRGFDDELSGSSEGARVEFMTSEGTLAEVDQFSGLKSILSGPAGGVVGYSLTSWDDNKKVPIVGFDMGGTSTDVSRYAGRAEVTYESTTAGISIQSPQLDINTVAAGGGSCLAFKNGLFQVGPASAGAEPGPVCYRKQGGLLTTTDANLVLGRLSLDHFPKIFGETEDQPLDLDASRARLQELADEINASMKGQGGKGEMTLDEVAYGFVAVANETMARPIRSLTDARGYASSKHALASFGGAGGQHACGIARNLGIKTVIIHKHSSILSAFGMALADRSYEQQEPCSQDYTDATRQSFLDRLENLSNKVHAELKRQGFADDRIKVEESLNMRYEGSDTSLFVLAPSDGSYDFQKAFEEAYKEEFGFLQEGKLVQVDDVRVRGIGKSFDELGESVWKEVDRLEFGKVDEGKKEGKAQSVYFDKVGRVDVPVYLLERLEQGEVVEGPAILVDGTATLVCEPGARAKICRSHVYIELE